MDVYKMRMGDTQARPRILHPPGPVPQRGTLLLPSGATCYFLSTEHAQKKHPQNLGHIPDFYATDSILQVLLCLSSSP